MKLYSLPVSLSVISALACSSSNVPDAASEAGPTSIDPGSTSNPDPDTGDAPTSAPGTTEPDPDTGTPADGSGAKFDVGGVTEVGKCETAAAGIYCEENVATECDGNGHVVSSGSCLPGICVTDVGCVVCLEGQYHCSGPRVMTCDANAAPPRWTEVDVCDPVAGEGCDQATGACEVLQPIGTNVVTGNYYQYANFPVGFSGYQGGFDVDSYGDLIYVTDFGGTHVDVYRVDILDSDQDGEAEPNQHPDNPDDNGPIEERTLEYVETINNVLVYDTGLIASEIYALEDRMFVSGTSITEYEFGVDGGSIVTSAPAWTFAGFGGNQGVFSQLGYDDLNQVWYASNEAGRRVLQHDAETDTWGIAFLFPDLAGDHMDGLEVVTDPNTGEPYVYVSDMTSDFIGQYRLDDEEGWVQANLFQYAGTVGESVEGMGFGALNHFWVTGYAALYEIGGGDLSTYTEPAPTG